ncbi:MAG TPA: hypothetical protein PKV72_01635 [Candidatus Peribacteria bacterium]|nr:hypothetical protein [Candidatus Peribacteria bacterium]
MAKTTHAAGKHRHSHENQARSIILMGAAFVVVMMIAIGYRQSSKRFQAHVYAPLPADQINSGMPSENMQAGACCAEGECLDLQRADCTGEGYVYWPDADLCLTACRAIQ